jgi:hypothetical protein
VKCRLTLRGHEVTGPFQLLHRDENGLTFALGYLLSRSSCLLALLMARLGLPALNPSEDVDIALQERGEGGITDIEVRFAGRGSLVLIEAKVGGWPGIRQLSRYARRFTSSKRAGGALVALGVPPYSPALCKLVELRSVRLVLLRWADLLQLVSDAVPSGDPQQGTQMEEYRRFIEEVIEMRSYDREVLVRDLTSESLSYELFLERDMYVCQADERAEPLFFAPCFTKAAIGANNGIHYVSRVYYKTIVRLKDRSAGQEALRHATEIVDRTIKPLRSRKGAGRQVRYLRALPAKWARGLRSLAAHRGGEARAVFFLGDPMRLPLPLKKRGYMVPKGFSMTVEQLMSAEPGLFNC